MYLLYNISKIHSIWVNEQKDVVKTLDYMPAENSLKTL